MELGTTNLIAWAAAAAGIAAAGVQQLRLPEPALPTPTAITARAAAPEAAPPRGSLAEMLASAMRSTLSPERPGELFGGVARVTAPQAALAPAARPAMPPFPFKYAGWVRNNGVQQVFLERGSMVLSIKAGEVLEGFRIDAIGDDRLEVTYLAADQQSSILFASLTGAGERTQPLAGSGGVAGATPVPTQLASAGNAPNTASTAGFFAASAGGMLFGGAPAAAGAGSVAPPSGSMPNGAGAAPSLAMQIGPAPSGIFPAGATPSGRLGTDVSSTQQLGVETANSSKLGL